MNAEDNSPSKPNIPKEKAQPQSPVAKPKPKQTKVDKTQKNRPVIDKKTTKPKKGDVYSRGATDSKKSAKIISKSPADPKQVASNGSKEQIHEAEDQVRSNLIILGKYGPWRCWNEVPSGLEEQRKR